MSALKQKLGTIGARAGILAAASAAVLAISGASAGSALAATECGTGTPANIQGQGSSLQRVAQENWTGWFVPTTLGTPLPHEPATGGGYASKCKKSESKTQVSYTSTSSGEGLTAFRYKGTGSILNGGASPETGYSFVGSDDGPTIAEIENAEAATSGGVASGANGLIIPVAETSIAVVIHPPEGCKFKTGKTHGISYEALNKVFAGTLNQWSEFGTSQVEGTCSSAIKRVVREDSSGTTLQFKNYLSVLETTQSAAGPGCSLGTWSALKEGTNNTVWPECTTTVTKKKGGGEIAATVKATAGTIGYVALPDAIAKGAEVVRLQDTKPAEYALPESGTASNCGKRVYTVPTARVSGDGEGEGVNWNTTYGASATVGSELYPLCTLTYDIAWSSYAKAGYSSTSAANIAADVKKYIKSYVLGEGQSLLSAKGYQALPSTPGEPTHDVLAAAELAAGKIG
jgi:ABC-type phosphate transport system substrate-binding protein